MGFPLRYFAISLPYLCCLSAFLCLAGIAQAQRPSASPPAWSVYRGNPAHTGYSETQLRPPLRLLWRRQLAKGSYGASYVLASDRGVYVATVPPSSRSEAKGGLRLSAVAPETGRIRWQKSGVYSTGCLSDGLLVTTLRVKGETGVALAGIDERTGTVRWQQSVPDNRPEEYLNAYGGQVFGPFGVFSARTGAPVQRWQAEWPVGGPALNDRYATSLLTGESDLVGQAWQTRRELTLRDRSTSAAMGAFPAGGDRFHALANGYLLSVYEEYNSPGGFWAVPLSNILGGKPSNPIGHPGLIRGRTQGVWSTPADYTLGALAVFPGLKSIPLVTLFTRYENPPSKRAAVVRALNIRTGKEVWATFPLTASAPGAAVPGTLYLPAGSNFDNALRRGGLYALAADTGKIVWRYEKRGLSFGAPAIANKKLFAFGSDGYLYAFGEAPKPKHALPQSTVLKKKVRDILDVRDAPTSGVFALIYRTTYAARDLPLFVTLRLENLASDGVESMGDIFPAQGWVAKMEAALNAGPLKVGFEREGGTYYISRKDQKPKPGWFVYGEGDENNWWLCVLYGPSTPLPEVRNPEQNGGGIFYPDVTTLDVPLSRCRLAGVYWHTAPIMRRALLVVRTENGDVLTSVTGAGQPSGLTGLVVESIEPNAIVLRRGEVRRPGTPVSAADKEDRGERIRLVLRASQ
jgi:outer membrane protein assembly factor BamB